MKHTVAATTLLTLASAYTGKPATTASSGVVQPIPGLEEHSVDSLLAIFDSDGAFVPPRFGEAVEAFDIEEPTIDAECYQAQVDIYSDQLVAIEATRVILQQLAQRVERAEEEIETYSFEIAHDVEEVSTYSWETKQHETVIDELSLDLADAEDCLER